MNTLLDGADAATQTVGVVGAGTMGAGIAQVAAAAGHTVKLIDLRHGAAQAAIDGIAQALQGLVDKGRFAPQDRSATLARLHAATSMADMADAALVVEVIVEDLAAKRALLAQLEGIVAPQAVLASNTSSISITAIANGLKHPQRVVGMHFFNPVPVMKLVEVVSGAETNAAVAEAVFRTATRWGKTAVHAASTPGFIVNRIARPFYAEALALLQDRAATPSAVDALARSGGFRLGPCELMDLIGHDVNYAVTQSVFEANHGDRRYAPSLVQKALIDGGRLGRKAGRGFYDGGTATATTAPAAAAPDLPVEVVLAGDAPLMDEWARWLEARGTHVQRDRAASWNGLRGRVAAGTVELHLTDGRTAAQCAAERGVRALAVIDWPAFGSTAAALGIAFAGSADASDREAGQATLHAVGFQPVVLGDAPALWAARTLSMLINEAADAVQQGVCSEAGANQAMRLGTNWPAGPFEWLQQHGVEPVCTVLDALWAATRNERYRISPWLQQRRWAARQHRGD